MIQKRKLGSSDIMIAPLVFGTNVFGWTTNNAMTFKLLDAFTEQGFNTIDTADVYSKWVDGHVGGESELAIGKWLKHSGKREQIILATKVGAEIADNKKGLSKKYIISAAEASLRRLQTDYIDLYQSHYDDIETPATETLEAYDILIKAGKVRAIGASNFTPERLLESLKTAKANNLPIYQTFQPEYNLYDRKDFEQHILPVALENELSIISYFSLASGFLTGKYRSETDLLNSKRSAFVGKYLNSRGFGILDALDKVAAKHNTVPGTIAIAWVLAQPAITAPIASATNLDQLEGLIAAVSIKLDQEDLSLLETASLI
ncbi:aldo/keto reductase [Pedobacter cryoconitis]|uniref:Aryl-alcohol dehydrogenase-like predicted oxidoreductase n=1 Tax=Pedobacter cryoconitis TaxID=188932 RepID=A0A7X0IZN5_9SPHI|nr:aldo/keto reductase [Pedobacter cryoconitis]MBB6498024.1 aryl-alcohol dehydrogenase-like predicted oxidoreductase [Pedobacter cryoconitis]